MSLRPATADAAAAVHIPDHTLLRVIGRGSYGEVWLARNIMGTLRAVKIVRRAAFDSDRPYLREFEGIRRCEPVSRAHDGLIDILHMGRDDGAGWFYYVMELADDAAGGDAPGTHSLTYKPATLSALLTDGKLLEMPVCLRIAESLAGALAFLHEQGLIHRDVKPSNVLYVGGMPKLGDIGLVAEAGSSRSYVGTEGFVPLEGPGTERADIYALGKVLYEALTGMDRSKFPQLPAEWRQAYDFEQRLELNEIVLRACEGDAVRRYHSAREMLADVAFIASGRSVRKLRGIERRVRHLKWIAGSVAVLALAALGVSGLWQQQAARERTLRLRAEQAESAEREARFDALLNLVHAARPDPSPGAVTRALEVIRTAAALHPTPELRDDAIFLLSRPDFEMRPDLKLTPTQPIGDIDADSGLMAEMPQVRGAAGEPLTITLHTAGAREKKRSLTIAKPPPSLTTLQFSRGGRRLLAAGWYGAGAVLDTTSGEVLDTFPQGSTMATPPVFCGAGGNTVIRRAPNGGLDLRELPPGGKPDALSVLARLALDSLPGKGWRSTPPLPDWPARDQRQSGRNQSLWPSPDGRFVLLIDEELELPGQAGAGTAGAACLAEVATGHILWKVSGPDEQTAAWSPDGTRIAVRAGDRIVSLDAATGRTAATVPQRIVNRGTQLEFLDSPNILVFVTYSMTGLCNLALEIMLGRPPVVGWWNYSRDRGLLVASTGTASWRPSPVLKIFPPQNSIYTTFFSFSPKEDWFLTGHGSIFACWRTGKAPGEPDSILPAQGASHVLFPGDGTTAQFLTAAGRHETMWSGEPPKSLPAPQPYGPGASGKSNYVSASLDGKVLAFGGNRYVIVRREGSEARAFPNGDSSNPVALSPDGRWLAVGAFHQAGVRIFDLNRSDDKPVHVVANGPGCYPVFSPDGQWLACSGFYENRVLRVPASDRHEWILVHSRPRTNSSLIGYISFSADSRLMSVNDTMTRCAIIEPGTWRTLYHIDSPLDEIFEINGLSPSGRYFAAVGTRREIYLWDLKALESELTALGLGVMAPAPP